MFSDEDKARLEGLLLNPSAEYARTGFISPTESFSDLIIRLLARLQKAEDALLSCKRYQYDDGLVIVEEPKVELYEAWRKATGK